MSVYQRFKFLKNHKMTCHFWLFCQWQNRNHHIFVPTVPSKFTPPILNMFGRRHIFLNVLLKHSSINLKYYLVNHFLQNLFFEYFNSCDNTFVNFLIKLFSLLKIKHFDRVFFKKTAVNLLWAFFNQGKEQQWYSIY